MAVKTKLSMFATRKPAMVGKGAVVRRLSLCIMGLSILYLTLGLGLLPRFRGSAFRPDASHARAPADLALDKAWCRKSLSSSEFNHESPPPLLRVIVSFEPVPISETWATTADENEAASQSRTSEPSAWDGKRTRVHVDNLSVDKRGTGLSQVSSTWFSLSHTPDTACATLALPVSDSAVKTFLGQKSFISAQKSGADPSLVQPLPLAGAQHAYGLEDLIFGMTASADNFLEMLPFIKLWVRVPARALFLLHESEMGSKALAEIRSIIQSEGLPIAVRFSRIEVYEKRFTSLPRELVAHVLSTHVPAKWFMLCDTDTFWFPENLVALLAPYDHSRTWYLGDISDNKVYSKWIGPGLAWGGGGIVLSRYLASLLYDVLPTCQKEWEKANTLGGGDVLLGACIKDYLGITVTRVFGFHQMDFLGDASGFMESGIGGLASLHHWKKWLVLIPNASQGDFLVLLSRAYARLGPLLLKRHIWYSQPATASQVTSNLKLESSLAELVSVVALPETRCIANRVSHTSHSEGFALDAAESHPSSSVNNTGIGAAASASLTDISIKAAGKDTGAKPASNDRHFEDSLRRLTKRAPTPAPSSALHTVVFTLGYSITLSPEYLSPADLNVPEMTWGNNEKYERGSRPRLPNKRSFFLTTVQEVSDPSAGEAVLHTYETLPPPSPVKGEPPNFAAVERIQVLFSSQKLINQ